MGGLRKPGLMRKIRMRRGDTDLDSAMKAQEEYEAGRNRGEAGSKKALVGVVEQYYAKLGVAGIRLTDTLKVGDVIEIGGEEEAIRQRLSSMQINRKDVDEAYSGDSVGVKLRWEVEKGSNVYRVSMRMRP